MRRLFLVVLLLALAGVFASSGSQAAQVTLSPSQDVHIWTFGGGQGGNAFLRFNISPVPGGAVIDSVILELWVWSIAANWDRDVKFWNVNSQTWTEADSARVIWAIPASDTILQASGFATAVGWARSVNLAPIFLRDYSASRTFMSVKLKDPDDPTTTPMPGSMPNNAAETLAVGNQAFTQQVYTSPRECADTTHRPKLTVFYSVSGVEKETAEVRGQRGEVRITAKPNPFTTFATLPGHERKAFSLYDVSGRLVGTCKGDRVGEGLKAGVYFLRSSDSKDKPLRVVKVR